MIHTSAATISERSLPHALGLEVLEMVVKHVDQPIKGFDDKSTLQPSRALTGRHVETVMTLKEAKRLLAERGGMKEKGLPWYLGVNALVPALTTY